MTREITARPAVGAVSVQLAPGVTVPSPVIATGTCSGYDVEMVLTVQPHPDGLTSQLGCSSLTIRQRPGSSPVSSAGLRAFAVSRLVREAASQVIDVANR
jgi:hypothetical protein